MSNNKQSSVDFLLKELQEIGVLNIKNCHWSDEVEVKKAIQQAKEMEKQQIMDAWDDGNDTEMRGGKYKRIIREKYYNKEYGS